MKNFKLGYDNGTGPIIPLKCLVSDDIYNTGRNVGLMVNELFDRIESEFTLSTDKPTGVLIAEISFQNGKYIVKDGKKQIGLVSFLKEQDRSVYNALVLSHEIPKHADMYLQFTPLVYGILGQGIVVNQPSHLKSYKF